jgi:flagellar FliL protein
MAKKDDAETKPAAPAAEGAEGEVKPLDDEGKGFGAKKLLLIIVPVILIGVGAALYFTGVIGGKKDAGAEGEHAAASAEGGEAAEGGEGKGQAAGPQFMELPDLLVNLSGAGGPARFLKLKVKLEVASAADLEALTAVAPRVIDQFQTFLREMRVQDLRGSAGIYRLRQELLYRVNLAAQPVKVRDVLFQEILIQ